MPRRARQGATKAGAKPTPEEALDALDDYIAYFGTYSIDEHARTVTHHRLGSVQPSDMRRPGAHAFASTATG